MSDRQFVRLNANIATASNSKSLLRNEEGDVQAIIDLRLPDNMISPKESEGVQAIDLLPTKLRVSMLKTPIAQIPVEEEGTPKSTCQLDVYPYCLTNGTTLEPSLSDEDAIIPFPSYKKHAAIYKFRVWDYNTDPDNPTSQIIEQYICPTANVSGSDFPVGHRFYPFVKASNTQFLTEHTMSLVAKTNHEHLSYENGALMVKDIATLEQMFQDALENAISFASVEDTETIFIDLLSAPYDMSLTPTPTKVPEVYVAELNVNVCYWKWEKDTEGSNSISSLNSAVKPRVSFDSQTLTIEYDSGAFKSIVPIIWNTPFVETYDVPDQMTMDTVRSAQWIQPPPKRIYQYAVSTSDNPASYNFALKPTPLCAAMNIIGNEAMKNTFSFLPWVKVDGNAIGQMTTATPKHVEKTIVKQTSGERTESLYWASSADPETELAGNGYTLGGDTDYAQSHEGMKVILYYYWTTDGSDEDPSQRSHQQIIYGTVDAHIYGSGFSFPRITSTTTLESTETTTPYYQYSTYEDGLSTGEFTSAPVSLASTTDALPPESMQTLDGSNQSFWLDETGIYQVGVAVPNDWAEEPPNYLKQIPPWAPIEKAMWNWDGTPPEGYYSFYSYIRIYDRTEYPTVFYNRTSGATYWKEAVVTNQQQQYVKTVITDLPAVSVINPQVEPNLTTDDNTWYILDGTTAQMSIGQQEAIKNPAYVEGFLYEVDTETTSYTMSGVQTETQDTLNMRTKIAPHRHTGLEYKISGYPFRMMFSFYMTLDDDEIDEILDEIAGKSVRYILTHYPEKIRFRGTNVSAPPTAPEQSTSTAYSGVFLLNDVAGENEYTWNPSTPEETSSTTFSKDYSADESLTPGTTTERISPPETTRTLIEAKSATYLSIARTARVRLSNNLIAECELIPGMSSFPLKDGVVMDIDAMMATSFLHESCSFYWVPDALLNATVTGRAYALADPSNGQAAYLYGGSILESDDGLPVPGDITRDIVYNDKTIIEIFSVIDLANSEGADTNVHTYRKSTLTEEQWEGTVALWEDFNNWTIEYQLTNMAGGSQYQTTMGSRLGVETTTVIALPSEFIGNTRLTFSWPNLPIVIMSPIQSIVLTLDGVRFNNQIQPINVQDQQGSSLTTSVPILETYYSMASTLRDLHDELVIVKDDFADAALFRVDPMIGSERTLRFRVQYITKDGALHQLYIPNNGTFTLQMAMCLYY